MTRNRTDIEEQILPADGEFEAADTPEAHLRDYVQIVLQRLSVALSVFAAVMLIGILYTWTRVPRYRATSQILVERGQIDLTELKGAYDPALGGIGRNEFLQTQVKLITSQPVVEEAFQQADLASDPEFGKNEDPVAALTQQLSAVPVRNTHLIDISIEREDPRQAARIVNSVVDAFLSENRKRMLGISEDGLQELYKKADALRDKLDSTTRALQDFTVNNNVVSFEKTQNIILDRLRDLSRALTSKEPLRIALQAEVDAAREALKNGQTVETLPEVMRSPVMTGLKIDLVRLENEYSQMLSRLGESHPQIQAICTQIDRLRTKIALEAGTILSSIEIKYDQALKEGELLRQALREHEKEVFRFNELATQYNPLKQQHESIDNTYRTIIRRIEEIDINRMGAQGNNIFVISRATVPAKRSWPSRGRNMLVCLLLAGGLAVGLCFFLDYMDTTVKSELDVRNLLRSDVIAAVPERETIEGSEYHPDLASHYQPRSNFAESFRSLRTSLAFSAGGGELLRRLVVTSALPQEGKSLVAVNLALAEAQTNRKTLIIDADLRKPRLHTVFGVSAINGLSSLLLPDSKITLDQVTVATEVDNLSFLPSGPIPPRPVEILDSPRFTELMKQIVSEYDFVIIDAPPSIEMVDATVMSKRVDGVLLVLRSFTTPKTAAREAFSHFRQAGVRIAGVVLNNVDRPSRSYHGYGPYGYGKTRGYYGAPHPPSRQTPGIKGQLKSLINRIRGRPGRRG
jgi:succinoglycan biosynthesis transport protein ExoP